MALAQILCRLTHMVVSTEARGIILDTKYVFKKHQNLV